MYLWLTVSDIVLIVQVGHVILLGESIRIFSFHFSFATVCKFNCPKLTSVDNDFICLVHGLPKSTVKALAFVPNHRRTTMSLELPRSLVLGSNRMRRRSRVG